MPSFRPFKVLPVIWSDHAIEPFGISRSVKPNLSATRKINEKADGLQNRTVFKVRDNGVVYVCEKFRKHIMVKTVYPKDPKDKTAYRRKILKDKKRVRAGSISASQPSDVSRKVNDT